MAVPTYQTIGTGTTTGASTVVITKPTGVIVGDLLLAMIGLTTSANRTINTLTGWTYITGANDFRSVHAFWRIATAADVSASNYTFTASAGTPTMTGAILRISGHAVGAEIGAQEHDNDNVTSTTLTYTTASTPISPENLIIMAVVGTGATNPNVTAYTTTPSATFTERADLGLEIGANDHFFGLATAPYTSLVQITSRQFTISTTSEGAGQASALVIVSALQDASGTVSLHAVSPTFFNSAASAGTSGTVALHAVSPTFPTLNGRGSKAGTWTDQIKPPATWVQETK